MAEVVAVGKRHGRVELVKLMNLIVIKVQEGTLTLDEVVRCLKKKPRLPYTTGEETGEPIGESVTGTRNL